jgi:two-component system, chemotaxis family, chemotaxis protein CheY
MSRAMVVDDSRAMRMILSKALAGAGFGTVQAANGREALQTIERDPGSLSLVTVDWNMPEMSGLEFIRLVRARPECASIRLLMITTETEIEQMQRALDAGADEYLMKPFTAEAVQDKLRLLGFVE